MDFTQPPSPVPHFTLNAPLISYERPRQVLIDPAISGVRNGKALLLDDPRNNPRSNCPPSLADVEALAVFNSDGVVYVAHHLDVVTWHDHF